MIRCRSADEAKEVCKDRNKWHSTVSAYHRIKACVYLYVLKYLSPEQSSSDILYLYLYKIFELYLHHFAWLFPQWMRIFRLLFVLFINHASRNAVTVSGHLNSITLYPGKLNTSKNQRLIITNVLGQLTSDPKLSTACTMVTRPLTF